MPGLFFIVGVLTVLSGIATIVVGPTAIQQIGGCVLWCGGWGIIGMARLISRVDMPFDVQPLPRKDIPQK